MFWLYKAIIRHHINKDFYPTAHFLKSSFHVAFYILSCSVALFRVYWCALVRIVCLTFTVKTGCLMSSFVSHLV
jgi:hypothetical protein